MYSQVQTVFRLWGKGRSQGGRPCVVKGAGIKAKITQCCLRLRCMKQSCKVDVFKRTAKFCLFKNTDNIASQ